MSPHNTEKKTKSLQGCMKFLLLKQLKNCWHMIVWSKYVDTVPYICSPLSIVVGPADKKQLVLNLRNLNQFLRKDKFKFEDIKTAMQMLVAGDFMIKFDFESGYHHNNISIYTSHTGNI